MEGKKTDGKRLTWVQIVKKYPHMNVGLVDVETGINEADVKSAVVKFLWITPSISRCSPRPRLL